MNKDSLNEERSVTMSLRGFVFLSRCMSQRGGTHPGEVKKNEDAYMEAQDAILNVFGEPPVETCSAEQAAEPFTQCAENSPPPKKLPSTLRPPDEMLEVAREWNKSTQFKGRPGGTFGGPNCEAAFAAGMAHAAKLIEADAIESARVCEEELLSGRIDDLNNPDAITSFNGRIFGFQNFGHRVARGDWLPTKDEND